MKQTLSIVVLALVAFVAISFGMLRFMPEPLKDSDYLIAGSVATLVALLILFLGLVSTKMKSSDIFFKRRPKK